MIFHSTLNFAWQLFETWATHGNGNDICRLNLREHYNSKRQNRMKDDVVMIWIEQQHNLGLKGMLYLTGGNDMTPYDHQTLPGPATPTLSSTVKSVSVLPHSKSKSVFKTINSTFEDNSISVIQNISSGKNISKQNKKWLFSRYAIIRSLLQINLVLTIQSYWNKKVWQITD